MKLSEIVLSNEWDENIKQEFFVRLRRSPLDYHKMKNCVDKSYNIASTGDSYKVSEAIKLLDYAMENYDDNYGMAYSLQINGHILERYSHDFLAAYECCTKWSQIDTNSCVFG
ncbi:hypothetical protein [uncultured Methanolobus sp.]|uniref:hypothetical protein n=1 Tax=uncultured Methanolobus sp. TaxID=218300 RepID=UPI002AABFFD3|nr:hypothetical protein [uncultured Methanolobus sp.]